jgi:hypothetical protein
MGDYERLSAAGLSSTLVEFFDTYDSGNWRLLQSWEGEPFYLLGLYLYKNGSETAETARNYVSLRH